MRMWRYRGETGRVVPVLRWFCRVIFGFVISFSVIATEEDDYLSALQQEADKVDERAAGVASAEAVSGRLSRESFESELKEKYAGSAVFYSKLEPGSQEEIYREYQSGATISQLRKKIMDRFLHR